MKLLFFTDIHGNRDVYREGFAAAERLGAVAVLGGDLMPDPFDVLEDPAAMYSAEADFFAAEFARLSRPPCLIYGNHDYNVSLPFIEALEARRLCRLLNGRAAELEPGLWIAGVPSVPITPGFPSKDFDRRDAPGWEVRVRTKRVLLSDRRRIYEAGIGEVLAKRSIKEELAELEGASDPARTVYVMHSPPADTALDHMYGGAHVGSGAIRRFIERHGPPLTLHGHIHEAPALTGRISERLGRTLMVNPGSSDQWLRGVLVDAADPAGTLEPVP
jgi:Icc-related predicted phosphoesterase